MTSTTGAIPGPVPITGRRTAAPSERLRRWQTSDRLVGEAELDSAPDTVDEDDRPLPPGLSEAEVQGLSTRDLSAELFSRLSLLVKEQVSLARLELRRDLDRAKVAALLVGAGAILLLATLILLLVAIAQVIGTVLPAPVGSVIIAVAALLIGGPLVYIGVRRMPAPMLRSREELKEEIAWTKTRLA